MPPLSKKKKKRKKNDIKSRESKVVLFLDQRGRVKQKFYNLRSN